VPSRNRQLHSRSHQPKQPRPVSGDVKLVKNLKTLNKSSSFILLSHFHPYLIGVRQTLTTTLNKIMAKALTKSQIASEIADKNSLTKKQAVEILEQLAALAYKHAKDSFVIPGLGKLVLVNRKARVGRNPATGETIQIKAKKVVKFRVAKAAKDAILGVKK
jgi:DNA-binding protein HU-beta